MSTEDSDQEDAQDAQDVLSTKLGDRYTMMTEENKLEVLELYKSNHRLLYDFKQITDFMDYIQQHPRTHIRLWERLKRISFDKNREQIIRFVVAIGFVDTAVEMYLRLREEMGNTPMTRIDFPYPTTKMASFADLYSKFFDGTCVSARFALCLARLGVLPILANDVRHMQHASEKDLEDGHLYTYSVCILLNCCTHQEVLPTVRDLGAVDCIMPFLAKCSPSVRALALMTLAWLVNDSERSLLQLDSDLFGYFYDRLEEALAANADEGVECTLYAVLHVLSVCARLDNNRAIMSTDSFLHMLAMALQNSEKEEKTLALAIVGELGKSSESLQDLARMRSLRKALQDVQCSADQTMAQDAASVLSILPAEDEEHPHLTAVLADQMNLLTLGNGEVDFVINQVKELCAEGGGKKGTSDVTRLTVLQALTELAQNFDTAKEIVDKRGLEVLSECLQRKDAKADVKRQTLLALQQLSCHKDCCDRLKMQKIPGLVETLKTLRKRPGGGFAHLSADILKLNPIPPLTEEEEEEDEEEKEEEKEEEEEEEKEEEEEEEEKEKEEEVN